MKLLLDTVAFLGRELSDYEAMFGFSCDDLTGKTVLDVASGPSSFNAELTQRGGSIISVDPLYDRGVKSLSCIGHMDLAKVFTQMTSLSSQFNFGDEAGLKALQARRTRALTSFLADYSHGRAGGRYRAESLPKLPFENKAFDLVLSANLLFLYSDQLTTDFHLAAVRELIRISREEVRLYPLIGLDGKESVHLGPVLDMLAEERCSYEIDTVKNEVLKGSNCMLRVRSD